MELTCARELTCLPTPACAGFNALLKYMAPLIVSLACNMEPLLGSLLGWAVGVVAAPGLWTYIGRLLGGLPAVHALVPGLADRLIVSVGVPTCML